MWSGGSGWGLRLLQSHTPHLTTCTTAPHREKKIKIKIVTVMEFPAICQRQYIELNNRAQCKNVHVFRNSCLNLAIILPLFLLCLHNYESPKFTLPKTQVCNCRYVPKRKIV